MTDLAADLMVYAARFIRHVRRDLGVPAAYRVLAIIDETGPIGISRLATTDGISQPAMSAQINAMVADGLVAKEPHPSDARALVVTLTETGRTRLAESRHHLADAIRAQLAGVDDTALAAAVEVLKTLSKKGLT